jgi:Arc/MetJ-type ribon-helix-helix transcriptional regulator
MRPRTLPSRSAVLRKAVRLMRASELGAAYEDAWESFGEELWDVTAGDGLTDAMR